MTAARGGSNVKSVAVPAATPKPKRRSMCKTKVTTPETPTDAAARAGCSPDFCR